MKTAKTSNDPFYIDKQIKKQLLKGQEAIRIAGQDRIYLITGKEGAGKSLLAIQLAYFVDNNLSLDDITMTADDFFDKVRTTTKKVVIGDEIFAGLSSKGALTKENKRLVKLLIECRQRGLTIFLCIPSIFLLEKYVAIFRSHALFNVQISRRSYKNRFYKVYNYMNKKILFMAGHKYMSYSKPVLWKKHRFYGKFPPTIKKEDYENKKARAFKEIKGKEYNEDTKVMKQRDLIITDSKETNVYISKLFNDHKVPMTPQSVGRIRKNTRKRT